MPGKTKKSAPAKLDETRLDAAVGGAAGFGNYPTDQCAKAIRNIIVCAKVVKPI